MLNEIKKLRREMEKLKEIIEQFGPQCNCETYLGLKRMGWTHSLEWVCPKHGKKHIN